MKDFLLFFSIQFVQYFLVTVNFRAAAIGLYGWTFVSDVTLAANGFFIIKRVSEAKGKGALIGYTLGGAGGSLLAIFITKRIYGA